MHNEWKRRQEKNPAYSLRAFARSLHCHPATLSRIMAGRSVPTKKVAESICLNLKTDESGRNRLMHWYSGWVSSEKKFRLQKALTETRTQEQTAIPISEDLFDQIQDWYHYAILELSLTRDFKPSPQWIAARLGITTEEAERALENLQKSGLLTAAENGTLRKTHAQLTTANKSKTSSALKKRHEQVVQKSIETMHALPIELRSHRSLTLAIDPSRIDEAKNLITEFNQQMCALMESGNQTEVYELIIDLFPLTQIKGDRK